MTLAALFLVLIATPADVAPGSPGEVRGEPVLLDFHTQWCPPCQRMRPAIAELAKAGYPIRSLDGDRERDLVRRYKVTAFPTFVVVDDEGSVLARTEGFQPAADLATLYRDAQARSRPRADRRPTTTAVSGHREGPDGSGSTAEDEADEDRPAPRKPVVPNPWETVVRIRMSLGNGAEGVGSGTIISSNARESIILTCAHIFKEEGRRTPAAAEYRTRISVDLFDGQLSGPRKNQVHYTETVRGEAIDYDLTNDVGLIRIRPGRVLAASPVVPPKWAPREKMPMLTVGCSEGREATAWSTTILRTMAKLKNTGTGQTFYATECDHAPKQGRSGGGLFTETGYLAGVCDFADPQHDNGLYAVPQSIYALLDKNRMTAVYDPPARDREGPQRLLAKDGGKAGRPAGGAVYRGQSPPEGDVTIPPPANLGIEPPVVASAGVGSARRSTSTTPWHAPGAGTPAVLAGSRRPPAASPEPGRPAEDEAVPVEMSRDGGDDLPDPPALNPAQGAGNAEDVPDVVRPEGPSKWRPVRRAPSPD